VTEDQDLPASGYDAALLRRLLRYLRPYRWLALGAVLLLDALEAIDLTFGVFAPVACAVAGAILLANGLSRRE
jgi:hypothetical protein